MVIKSPQKCENLKKSKQKNHRNELKERKLNRLLLGVPSAHYTKVRSRHNDKRVAT